MDLLALLHCSVPMDGDGAQHKGRSPPSTFFVGQDCGGPDLNPAPGAKKKEKHFFSSPTSARLNPGREKCCYTSVKDTVHG